MVETSNDKKPNIKFPVLATFVGVLTILAGVVFTTAFLRERDLLETHLAEDIAAAEHLLWQRMRQDTETMKAVLATLASRTDIRDVLLERDRQSLLRLNSSQFKNLKDQTGITHFYFLTPERVALLRLHFPGRHGDTINRRTVLQAEKRMEMSHGLELGPLGTLSMRVVMPWVSEGKIIGFVELGKEISRITTEIRETLNVDLAVFVSKDYLQRPDWETGMSAMGRAANWSEYKTSVIAAETTEWSFGDPAVLARNQLTDKSGRHLSYASVVDHPADAIEGRFDIGFIPLIDSNARLVGELAVIQDTSAIWSGFHLRVVSVLVVALLLVGAALAFFSTILKRVEARVYESQDDLERHIHDRTRDLQEEIEKRIESETALRKSQDSLANAQRIARLGNWDWEIETNALYWSDEIYRIFGLEPQQFGATYESFLDTIHPDDRQSVIDEVERCLESNDPYVIEHRIVLPDGHIKTVQELGEITFEAGQPVRMTGTVHDITRRKRIEEALLNAKQEAENANEAKSQFLAAMSHELRTPLNAIIGFADIFCHQTFGPLGSNKYAGYAEDIRASGKHLLSLVNDILDISAIEAGELVLVEEKVDVGDLIGECGSTIAELAQQSGVELNLDVPGDLPPLYSDRRAVKQIVLNLLSNAVKYTPNGGSVLVTVAVALDDLILCVEDTGIGIPADDIPLLLKPFTQGSRFDAFVSIEGTGLGLSIVASLVRLHHGKLDIESEVGKGTRVRITLPHRMTDERRLNSA